MNKLLTKGTLTGVFNQLVFVSHTITATRSPLCSNFCLKKKKKKVVCGMCRIKTEGFLANEKLEAAVDLDMLSENRLLSGN